MKIRPLIIGTEEHDDIRRVVEHAERNRIGWDELSLLAQRLKEGDTTAVSDDPQTRCVLPVGYRVVFSIEEHRPRWCRHLSISVDERGCLPGEFAVIEIARAFGFRGSLSDWREHGAVWLEQEIAVNVLEPLDWKSEAKCA